MTAFANVGNAVGSADFPSPTTPSSLTRAYLTQIDNPTVRVDFHFNPETISFHRDSHWTDTPKMAGQPTHEYRGTGSVELSLALLFDAVERQPAGSVLPEIEQLVTWLEPAAKNRDTTPLPSTLRFSWGQFRIAGLSTFDCTMRSLDVEYKMFSRTGLPIRATAKVALKSISAPAQATPGDVPQRSFGGTNPSSGGTKPYRTHVVRGGETLHSIAYRYYADSARWRGIALVNDIDDPLRVPTGRQLLLPAATDLTMPE